MSEYSHAATGLKGRFPNHFVPDNLVQHPAGFYQISPKPDSAELEKFYREKYFQKDHGNYKKTYSCRDQRHRHNRLQLRYFALNGQHNADQDTPRMLDIGCGEGWAMRWFSDRSWHVTGVDYSDSACKHHNQELAGKIRTGNVEDSLQSLIKSMQQCFDVVWLTNVLEHARDPEWLLEQLKKLSAPSGKVLIEVPNDFSITQEAAARESLITHNFWVCPPEHLNYFNLSGLTNLMRSCGWQIYDAFCDFPIDWFLLNEHANYISLTSRGKEAHAARERIESEMIDSNINTTLSLYRNLAQLGMGRNITVLATPGGN